MLVFKIKSPVKKKTGKIRKSDREKDPQAISKIVFTIQITQSL